MKVNIDTVWYATTVIVALCIGYQMKSIYAFQLEARQHGIEVNGIGDLKIMLVSLLSIGVYRKVAGAYMWPQVSARLVKVEPAAIALKYEKNVRAIVSFFWYCFASLLGLFLFAGHDLLPAPFLGGCACEQIIGGWPHYKTDSATRYYYMLMLGHHTYSLLELLLNALSRPDTAEMALHHIVTVSLMLFSYYQNHIPSGITLLVAHNVGDISINLAKFSRDLKLFKSAVVEALIYTTLLLSWSVPRVVLISYCVLPTVFRYLYLDGAPEDLTLRLF